jgi:transposase
MESNAMAATKTKTPTQRLALRAQMMELLAQGIGQHDIAKRLDLAVSTVSYWTQRIKEHEQALLDDRTALRRSLLAELDEVKAEAWAAWEKSKRTAKTTMEETGETEKGSSSKTRITREEQIGDPAFLAQVQNAIAQQRDLAGLDAPKAEPQVAAAGSGRVRIREVVIERPAPNVIESE